MGVKMTQDELKKMVGLAALPFIKPGMKIGLGTGSTVKHLVDGLGKRMREEGLQVTCVTTSSITTRQANELGIPLVGLDDVDHLDLTIDGADQVDENFNGIKGGGGSMLWEKIVNTASDQNIWIVDESKLTERIGSFGVPVEIVPYGASYVFRRLEQKGLKPTWRLAKDSDQLYRTDENNVIIDVHPGPIDDVNALDQELINMVGVVEHGLFIQRINDIIIGREQGPETIHVKD